MPVIQAALARTGEHEALKRIVSSVGGLDVAMLASQGVRTLGDLRRRLEDLQQTQGRGPEIEELQRLGYALEVCAPLGQSMASKGYYRKTEPIERRAAFQQAVSLLTMEANRRARAIVGGFLEGRLQGQRAADAAQAAELLLIYAHPFLSADVHLALREQYPRLQEARRLFDLEIRRGLEPLAPNPADFLSRFSRDEDFSVAGFNRSAPAPATPAPAAPRPGTAPGGFFREAAVEVPAGAAVTTYRSLNDKELEASRRELHRLPSSTRYQALDWDRRFALILENLLKAPFTLEARAINANGQLSVAFVLRRSGGGALKSDGLRRVSELVSLLLHMRRQPEETRRAGLAQLGQEWKFEDIAGTYNLIDALASQAGATLGFDRARAELWLRYELPSSR